MATFGRRAGLRLGIAFAFGASLGAGAWLAQRHWLPTAAVLPGLAIDGQRVEGDGEAMPTAVATARAKALEERRVRLVLPGSDTPIFEGTLGELGMRADVERTVATAMRIGKDGDLLGRAMLADAAREGRVDVPLFASIDRSAALRVVEALKETWDREPISARLDLDKHETVREKDGRYIDADGAIAAIEVAARDKQAETVTLPVATFAPRISSAFLAKLDISTVIAEYETYFGRRGDQQLRGRNIDNAAQKLDGLVISPGELVSFNHVIGERSEENGFHKSWEIFKGEMVEGVGGGTCQVASTFHAVAFFGGLDVLERLPHSRPSAYIPMGLDSTVVFPAVDLKVRNPHPFPLVVHASSSNGKLRVELLGKMRPARVSFGREILETLPYKRKILEEATLRGNKVMVKQHGIRGYKIKRSRLFTYPDGSTKKEELTDTYPPTTEIYQVPVGFDVALLPPLPGGDSEDADLGGNPSAAPPSARGPSQAQSGAATASAEASKLDTSVEMVDAPGAHAPTTQQRDPAKTIWLRH